jgi:hypothetical protein
MTLTIADDIDPQDCPDCVVDGQPCRYHQGWADAWDMCAQVVGALVLDAGGDR